MIYIIFATIMNVDIDPKDVLYHLNRYGIQKIDENTLNYFIRDLKKLIKYEQRYKIAQRYKTERVCSPDDVEKDEIAAVCRQSPPHFVNKHNSNNFHYKNLTSSITDRPDSKENIHEPEKLYNSKSRSRSLSANRKCARDPVALYHYYQSIWKHHKLPGEDDHSELRKDIRERLKVK